MSRRHKSRGGVGQVAVNLAVAAVTVGLLLGVVELTLRLTGFSFVLYPEDIEFGRPDPIMLETGFLEDDELFWVTKDYPEKLADLRERRPPLLLLGDSCTHLGRYDEALASLVRQRLGRDLEYGNLAVAGWSSFQGRQQVRRDASHLGAKVATLYFGWNDHWIGFGIEDKNVAQVKKVFGSRWSGLRLAQLAAKGAVAWGARDTAYPNRVSLGDFASNLETMVALLRRGGTTPVLLTAADNHRPGEEPVGLTERWLRQLDNLVPLHDSYVETVRQVAAAKTVPLCDLAARFDALPETERAELFRDDGIHFTAAGDQQLARFLFECFEQQGLWQKVLE